MISIIVKVWKSSIDAVANVGSLTVGSRMELELTDETGLTISTMTSGEFVAVAGTGGQCEDRDTITVNAIAAPDFDYSRSL